MTQEIYGCMRFTRERNPPAMYDDIMLDLNMTRYYLFPEIIGIYSS